MATQRLFGSASTRKKLEVNQIEDQGSNIMDLGVETWKNLKEDDRLAFIETVNVSYHRYVDEFYKLANDCVDRYDIASDKHSLWRRRIIVGTGAVAIINLLAANYNLSQWSKNTLPIAAAIAALALTIFANLESFHNFADRAQAYRESRELFLDTAREFQRVWEIYVQPFGSDISACINSAELYRRIVISDRELRSKFKELTKTKDGGKGVGSHGP